MEREGKSYLDLILMHYQQFETARLKTHVGGKKLKEKYKDAFSDGGDRYMLTFTEAGFSC